MRSQYTFDSLLMELNWKVIQRFRRFLLFVDMLKIQSCMGHIWEGVWYSDGAHGGV